MSKLHAAIENAIKEHCAGGDLWLCANIASEPFDARITELETAITVRDTEIARLETDLELARAEVNRLDQRVDGLRSAIEHGQAIRAIDAARGGS